MLSFLKKHLASEASLFNFLDWEEENKALKLINEGKEILANKVYASLPFIRKSMMKRLDSCTIALLENGADPNFRIKKDIFESTALEEEIQFKRFKNIKLLILYGAKLNKDVSDSLDKNMQDFIKEMDKLYSLIKQKETLIKHSNSDTEKMEHYKSLSQLWEEAANDEKNEVYRKNYESKMELYINLYDAKLKEINNKKAEEEKETNPLIKKFKIN